MITPIHIIFDFGAYSVLGRFLNLRIADMILLFSAELIDLDHLFSHPIYHPRRNPFKTHFLHKRWKIVLAMSAIIILYRPISFFGIGMLAHIFVDYCYVKIYGL
ncbi:MAG: DUF6122 family protein [bacterium]